MLLRKIKGITAVFIICAIFAVIASHMEQRFHIADTAGEAVRYILDAGHGVPDGGAVAADKTTEQELNLGITLKLSALLEQLGVPHILTRSDENSIFSEGKTIHAKKVSDIKNRIVIAEKNPNVPVVSIHMNSYPSSSVHGIQVFYSEGNESARKLAESLQSKFNETLQADNGKVIKPISKNVYFFSHISNPSVLIECGFLSNAEELEKLKTDNYQQQLAEIMAEVLSA